MIGHSERVGGHRCTGLGRVVWAGLTALLVVIPVTAVAQAQPPRLDVYSGTFGPSSGPAPGSSSGAELTVDVPGIDPLEVRLDELRQLMADHLAETSPHWPHGHPHGSHTALGSPDGHCGDGGCPFDGSGAPFSSLAPVPGHSELLERLARLVSDVVLPRAYAQAQPPALRVYSDDWGAGSTPAPTGATGPPARLQTDVPMLDEIDVLLRQLRADINTHVADVNAHPHDHVHTHGAGGTQFYHLAEPDGGGGAEGIGADSTTE